MRHLRRLGHCLAAAALFGAAVAPLQLLLWPEIALPLDKVVLALLAWASWSALWFGLIAFMIVEASSFGVRTLAVRRGLAVGLWRWLAFSFTLAAALSAWFNHRLTRETLLPGRRDALAVAVIVLGLAAIALLFMSLADWPRRYAAPVIIGVPVAAVAFVWFMWSTAPVTSQAEAAGGLPRYSAGRRVLLVSWEGADLPWILPAIERGDMPFLKERRDAGAWGQLRTLHPHTRQSALATLATGCSPAMHGVVGRRAYRLRWLSNTPVSLLLRGPWPLPHHQPWRARERAAVPPPRRAELWEILEHSGLTTGLVGWPGVVGARWQVPAPLASDAIPFSALDSELRDLLQSAFIRRPELAARTRSAFSVAAETIAAAAIRHANEPVDAMVIDSDLPARLRPLWTASSGETSEEEVLRQAMRLLDEQLRTLWSVMGREETLLVVVSPYGMAAPTASRRLQNLVGGRRQYPVSALDSPDGFILLSGPGIKPGTRLRGGKLADVVPTILYLLDLPVGSDMAGRVLLEAITDERAASTPLRVVPSYPVEALRP